MCTQLLVLAWLCQRLSVVGGKYVLIIHRQGQTCGRYLAAQSAEERQLSFQRSRIQNTECVCSTIMDESKHHLQFICTPTEWVQSAVCVYCMCVGL